MTCLLILSLQVSYAIQRRGDRPHQTRYPVVMIETAKLIIGVFFVTLVVLEWRAGRFLFPKLSSKKDTILDVVSTIGIPVVVVPTMLFISMQLALWFAPGSEDQWAHWSPWAMVGVLLLADDLTQYGWHRLSHSSWLYPLHRPTSAPYLSVRVVYRNNLIYYALMPGLWLTGPLLAWGFMKVYPFYAIVKMGVIISAHSSGLGRKIVSWKPTRPDVGAGAGHFHAMYPCCPPRIARI